MSPPPRLLPDVPLPAYAFIPGRSPHPVSHPAGHRFGRDLPPPEPLNAANWHRSRHYLLGIDLFNAGYYWEAHEMWERLWNAAGRRGPVAEFLKALIQLAVVGVKVNEGMPEGARWHARRAVELLQSLDSTSGHFMGLALSALSAEAARNDGSSLPGPLVIEGPELKDHEVSA